METPPIVPAQDWDAAGQELLVKEQAVTTVARGVAAFTEDGGS